MLWVDYATACEQIAREVRVALSGSRQRQGCVAFNNLL
jgi:hypothetical protein